MACKPIPFGFSCSRGRPVVAPCQEPHCSRDHAALCDYPVNRNGADATCSRRLCASHTIRVGTDRHYCQAHARANGVG